MEVKINEVALASVEKRDVVDQSSVVGAVVDRHGDGEVFFSAWVAVSLSVDRQFDKLRKASHEDSFVITFEVQNLSIFNSKVVLNAPLDLVGEDVIAVFDACLCSALAHEWRFNSDSVVAVGVFSCKAAVVHVVDGHEIGAWTGKEHVGSARVPSFGAEKCFVDDNLDVVVSAGDLGRSRADWNVLVPFAIFDTADFHLCNVSTRFKDGVFLDARNSRGPVINVPVDVLVGVDLWKHAGAARLARGHLRPLASGTAAVKCASALVFEAKASLARVSGGVAAGHVVEGSIRNGRRWWTSVLGLGSTYESNSARETHGRIGMRKR